MNGYNFTDRVRKVLQMAREEAARLHHEYVGTEHILLVEDQDGEFRVRRHTVTVPMGVEPGVFSHLDIVNECNLEREVFTQLAAARQVGVFPHAGYWQAVDTERDLQTVTALYTGNQRPWLSLRNG